MENRPFLSVVMPVYGVEKHLNKAVQSVLNQTVQDFEIILVDDCSPDNCPAICEKLTASDERISVIHHEQNQGLSGARNTGLKAASGQYVWFMDSDDYVEPDLMEKAMRSVEKNPAQVIVFGLTEDYYDSKDQLHHSLEIKEPERCFEKKEELREYVIRLEQKTLYGYAWNKFYQLDYLKNLGLQYEKVTLIEDILFNVKYFMDISSMNILDFSGYHYNKRMDNSLTSKFVPDYYELHRRRVSLIYNQYKSWELCTEEVKSILGALYTRYIFSAAQRNCDKRAKMNHAMRKQWVQNLYQDSIVRHLVPYGETDAKLLNVMLKQLQKQRVWTVLVLGRGIYICKEKLPLLFSAVKQKR